MARILIPARRDIPAESQPALDALDAQLGFIPNVFRVMALSPHVLMAFCAMRTQLRRTLDGKMRGRIALAISEVNECEYSISAHTYLAQRFYDISQEEMTLNRLGQSHDPAADVIVDFARKVIVCKGIVDTEDIDAVRAAGLSDGEIIDVVGTALYYAFANVINNVVQTDIDFPLVRAHPDDLN